MHFDLSEIIRQVGYIGIFAIVFAESGLLIGFFLPGDSLLFTAGFLASQGYLDVTILTIICWIAAVTGDQAGYMIGRKTGHKIFNKENSKFFHRDHLIKAEKFYEAHGGKTIILARFTPIIRTFAPVVAGAGKMDYKSFVFYNIIGGTLWTFSMILGGYFLGRVIPDVDKYILPIIAIIVLASIAPSAWHIFKEEENRAKLKHHAKRLLKRS
ncbi:MAG: VTT domain-containing protein [bacterium]|nr:VTT domain-containing protein [bacterium]